MTNASRIRRYKSYDVTASRWLDRMCAYDLKRWTLSDPAYIRASLKRDCAMYRAGRLLSLVTMHQRVRRT